MSISYLTNVIVMGATNHDYHLDIFVEKNEIF